MKFAGPNDNNVRTVLRNQIVDLITVLGTIISFFSLHSNKTLSL